MTEKEEPQIISVLNLEKIHQLVEEKICEGYFQKSSYWDWYNWIKGLGLGHRPTKAETNEVLFYGLSFQSGKGDINEGAKNITTGQIKEFIKGGIEA